MPDISQPVELSFIAYTIVAIFAMVAVGILAVKIGRKSRNP